MLSGQSLFALLLYKDVTSEPPSSKGLRVQRVQFSREH